MGTRRTFSREFKVEAVRLVVERRVSMAQAARELGVHVNVLRSWVAAYRRDPSQAFPGVGQQAPEAAELTQLRREVARLKMERDILKKKPARRRTHFDQTIRGLPHGRLQRHNPQSHPSRRCERSPSLPQWSLQHRLE